MNKRIEMFLKATSPDQKIFKYDSEKDEYQFLKGNIAGKYVSELLPQFREELKELLQNIFDDEESNYNTKQIILQIVNKHFKKKTLKKVWEL